MYTYIYIYIILSILLPYYLQIFFIDVQIEMIRYMYQHKRMNDTNFDDPLKSLKNEIKDTRSNLGNSLKKGWSVKSHKLLVQNDNGELR